MSKKVKISKGSVRLLFILAMLIYTGAKANDNVISTNRPMRNRQSPILTVGRHEGDLQGDDDKVIQARIPAQIGWRNS